MPTRLYLFAILGLIVFLPSCKKQESFCHSQCARCGRSYHTRTKSGITVLDEIHETDISPWLAKFRPAPCKHAWVQVSGGSNDLHWDGISYWNTCLRQIKQLHPKIGETETRKLLDQYYNLVEMTFETDEKQNQSILRPDPEVGQMLEDFNEELKSKIKQIE